jgi:hypothetical protein
MCEEAAITLPNHAAYALRRRATLIAYGDVLDHSRNGGWSYLVAIARALQYHPWAMRMDADAMFMRGDVDYTQFCDPNYDLIFCEPVNGLNAGIFFAQRTEATMAFLDRVYARVDCVNHDWQEQMAIMRLMAEGKLNDVRISVRKDCPFNRFVSVPPVYRPGDFVAHAAGLKGAERWAWLAERAKEVRM